MINKNTNSLSIPILMYHQIMSVPHPAYFKYSIATTTFAAQMKIIKLLGFTPINFGNLINYKEGRTKLPSRPIIISFDDGYVDTIENAVPILEALGFAAVFYIPTDFAGRTSSWDLSKLGVEFPVIGWTTIRQLDMDGFQIGSHSMTHPYLADLSSTECFDELKGSREKLEYHLGHEIVHLAYPYGSFNEEVRSIAADSGYLTACTVDTGFATSKVDLLALPRINVKGRDSLLDFIVKLYTGYNWDSYKNSKINGVKRLLTKMLKSKQ